MERVGQRVRALRKKQGLTLRELADKVGLSAGFLSQAERGASQLQVVHLFALSHVFGVSPADLLDDSSSAQGADPVGAQGPIVTKAEDALLVQVPNHPVTYKWLSGPKSSLSAEMCIVVVPPHVESPVARHAGEEFGYVLKGAVELHIDGQSYWLSEGDSFQFLAERPHSVATGAEGAEILYFQTVRYTMWQTWSEAKDVAT